MHKVSVIMSVYKNDSVEKLSRSIRSILEQSFQAFKLYIMVDGPISDGLSKCLTEFEGSKVIVFRRNRNLGLAYSLNELIDIVLPDDATFIARMDSDDVSHTDRFESQLSYFDSHPEVTVLGAACNEVDVHGNMLHLKVLPECHYQLVEQFIKRSPFNHPTVIFRKKVFESGLRYPTDVGKTEDYFLWANLLKQGEIFANVTKPLLDFTMTDETIIRRRGFRKGITEMRGRFRAIKIIERYTLKNYVYAFGHFAVRVSPIWLHRFIYKVGR